MSMDHLMRAYLNTYPCKFKECSFNYNGEECIHRHDMTLELWREKIKCSYIGTILRIGYPFIKLSDLTIEDAPLIMCSSSELKKNLASELLRDGSGI